MEVKNPLLVVKDINKSVEFYKKVLGLDVILDFGANKTLAGGLCLQTEDTFRDFIDGKDIFREDAVQSSTVDGCHPNDLGFYGFFRELSPIFEKIFG